LQNLLFWHILTAKIGLLSSSAFMIVGTEWLVEAFDCNAEILRDIAALQRVFAIVVDDLQLKVIGEQWHKFPFDGGVTGLLLLTESHLACHTYPEHRAATFNLYCCSTRPEWNWQTNLAKMLAAESVKVKKIERGRAPQKFVRAGESQ
jgi:S-adenosylmethionine decarboxylase